MLIVLLCNSTRLLRCIQVYEYSAEFRLQELQVCDAAALGRFSSSHLLAVPGSPAGTGSGVAQPENMVAPDGNST